MDRVTRHFRRLNKAKSEYRSDTTTYTSTILPLTALLQGAFTNYGILLENRSMGLGNDQKMGGKWLEENHS